MPGISRMGRFAKKKKQKLKQRVVLNTPHTQCCFSSV